MNTSVILALAITGKAMDLDAKVDYLYVAFENAAKKCFNIKEKFKDKDEKNVCYIPKEVRNLL